MSFVVAIDGPAGVGKGTIAKRVADDLGLMTIDTGATYRSVTVAIIDKGIKLDDIDRIVKLLNEIKIEMVFDGKEKRIYLDGKDVTTRIREDEINTMVSPVSSIKEVRAEMVKLQRKLADGKNVVMEGRDIGTVVFPNADVKIFLDASIEERAQRRYNQNQETGVDKELSYEDVYESIKARDYSDRNREVGPLKQADDAIIVDTTGKTLEENIKQVEDIIKEKINK